MLTSYAGSGTPRLHFAPVLHVPVPPSQLSSPELAVAVNDTKPLPYVIAQNCVPLLKVSFRMLLNVPLANPPKFRNVTTVPLDGLKPDCSMISSVPASVAAPATLIIP